MLSVELNKGESEVDDSSRRESPGTGRRGKKNNTINIVQRERKNEGK